jgi:hypothetical protein
MSWWWEFFDDRKMTPYFNNVRFINDEMMTAGKGSFEPAEVFAEGLESYAVKCGQNYFVYVLNNNKDGVESTLQLSTMPEGNFGIKTFRPGDLLELKDVTTTKSASGKIIFDDLKLLPKEEIIFVFVPEKAGRQMQ